MILIDLNKNRMEMSGSKHDLLTDFIVLAHTYVDIVIKKLPKDERESVKRIIASIIVGELGINVLEETGMIKGHTLIDASVLEQLKEDLGDEADG